MSSINYSDIPGKEVLYPEAPPSLRLSERPIYALVDCNNFFASCERVFRPDLVDKPIVVLSNNDGCVIARSNEAKALGIPMGAPYFKYKDLCREQGVCVFSSNYQLYGDFSERVMQSLRMLVPELEVYSIDEAFVRLDGIADIESFAHHLREKIRRWTGITVSIGVSYSKTLSKVANHLAKKGDGVYCLLEDDVISRVLASFPIEELWGIGRRLSLRMRMLGIGTAAELARADPRMIRRQFTVVGERIVFELRGQSCLDLEMIRPKKNIMSSRSFGVPVTTLEQLEEAVAHYVARAAVKLRHQNSRAQGLYVFVRTNRFKPDEPFYANGRFISLVQPSSDTRLLIKVALAGLRSIFRGGYKYHKAGVMLTDLIAASHQQGDLFVSCDHSKADPLMKSIDEINSKMGRNRVYLAAQGIQKQWMMKCDQRSPRYTTSLAELCTVI